jgi:hypothetical protein
MNLVDLPVDVHYAKMQAWLEDRREALQRSHPADYKLLCNGAPTLIRLAKFDVPGLKRAHSKALSAIAARELEITASARRADTAAHRFDHIARRLGLDPAIRIDDLDSAILCRSDEAVAALNDDLSQAFRDVRLVAALDYFAEVVGPAYPGLFPSVTEVQRAGFAAMSPAHTTSGEPQIRWEDDDDATVLVDDVAAKNAAERSRVALLDEFEALRSFFDERLRSLAHGSATSDTGKWTKALAGAPVDSDERLVTQFPVECAMAASICDVIARLQLPVCVELMQLSSSRATRSALVDELATLRYEATAARRVGEHTRKQAVDEAEALRLELEASRHEMKRVQEECEAVLRRMFAPREAYIVGDINTL